MKTKNQETLTINEMSKLSGGDNGQQIIYPGRWVWSTRLQQWVWRNLTR